MPDSSISSFAEALVRLVRDRAIRNCDALLTPGARSPISKHWQAVLVGKNSKTIGDVIIPDCVDEVIFCLLNAIDDGGLKLTYLDKDGKSVDLLEDGLGELAGWYVGPESWRHEFSSQRINDYLV
jgi:hypothetical protein